MSTGHEWCRTIPGSSSRVTLHTTGTSAQKYSFEILALLRFCLTQHYIFRDNYPTRVFQLPSDNQKYVSMHVLVSLLEHFTPTDCHSFVLLNPQYHHVSTLTTGFSETVLVYTRILPYAPT